MKFCGYVVVSSSCSKSCAFRIVKCEWIVQVQSSEAYVWWTGKKAFWFVEKFWKQLGKNATLYLLSDTREKEKAARKNALYVITYCNTILGVTEYFQFWNNWCNIFLTTDVLKLYSLKEIRVLFWHMSTLQGIETVAF